VTAHEGLLSGKRVVVAGGSRGLGRAIALTCAREGADLGVTFRSRKEDAEAVARAIAERFGRRSFAVAMDVTDGASVDSAVAELDERLGGIDGWVASAGETATGLLVAADPAALRRQLEVNLLGPMLCARAVIERMMRRRTGVLLFVSSVAAARPARGQAAYAAAKAGVEGLTRALAVEYAKKNVRVLCLRPGAIDTEMLASTRAIADEEVLARIPLRRVATPDEIAEHAAFALSDRAAYATGSVVTVDGGYAIA
jgi:3-oxoacyl-[acyl-carrier protein] reductase